MVARAAILTGLLVCALVAGAEPLVPLPVQPAGVPWPTETWPEEPMSSSVDAEAFARAVDTAFAAEGRGAKDTRALLAVHRGRIVFERYAEGFDRDSRFHSWSAAKSFTSALVGLAIARGELSLDAPAPVPAWREDGDPRGEITLRHLLNMTAGLDNGDGVGGDSNEDRADSFASRLLFGDGSRDGAAFAAAQAPIHPQGTHWAYSTGTSAIVAAIVGRLAGDDAASRSASFRAQLFDPLGIASARFSFDPAGNPQGGSHLYASARDYARFGLFILRGGVWEGRAMLPQDYVDFARTPAPAENNGTYGGHFWLNHAPKEGQFNLLPGGPVSAFAATGNAGQLVVMLPTHDLILVRLGEHQATTWNETNAYMAELAAAFPPLGGAAP